MPKPVAMGLFFALAACTKPAAPLCQPGVARCTDDANAKQQSVLRCNDAGTQWVVETSCPRCVDGSCANPSNPY